MIKKIDILNRQSKRVDFTSDLNIQVISYIKKNFYHYKGTVISFLTCPRKRFK